MANNKYDESLRKKVLRLHLEEGRTIRSLTAEYNLGKSTISYWLKKHREECETNPELQSETDSMLEVRKMKKRIEELEKENRFLKKAAAFFAKEID
jgi:transposase